MSPPARSKLMLRIAIYIPNLIGYLRIILTVVALRNYDQPWKFLQYYGSGFILDGADGLAARLLNQSSLWGAQLDMLTDRCATAALLVTIALQYPSYAGLIVALIFLDGYSHWMQTLAGTCAGTSSHKQASRGRLLNLYYWRPVLTITCFLNEACLLAIYLAAFPNIMQQTRVRSILAAVVMFTAPVFALKQVVSMRQILSAHDTIVDSSCSAATL